jgi:hypothetical protein
MVMLGQVVPGDGFGAQFFYDPLSIAIDNYDHSNISLGGSVINPAGNSGPGRWHRLI